MRRAVLPLLATIALSLPTSAKDKEKSPLPFTVLRANTIAVVIDPDAGRTVTDPGGNENAKRGVETALLNWGRFRLDQTASKAADLIIVVRKGTRTVEPTIPDPRQNGHPGDIAPFDDGVAIGAQRGRMPSQNNPRPGQPNSQPTAPNQAEISSSPDDSFVVYQGGSDEPLDSPAIWRYSAKDAKTPSVTAVDAFRKAYAETVKAASKNP